MPECGDRSGDARSQSINMTHTDHQESHGVAEPTRLLYGLNDKPPFKFEFSSTETERGSPGGYRRTNAAESSVSMEPE